MTILTHFVAGAAICRYVKSRPAGLVLAFASHFVLDAIPHFEHGAFLSPAGQPWGTWLPRVVSVLTLPLIWVLWAKRGTVPVLTRTAMAYVIFGGLLACLPDGLSTLFGFHSVPGWLNDVPHRLWAPGFRRLAGEQGIWSPLAAPLAIAAELLVLGLSAWLLLRRRRRA
jgi:hypothetical protein